MKIYNIALFMIFINLSVAFIVSAQILPVEITTVPMKASDFERIVPADLTYSNADIAMYIFGDFPRAIGMLAKILIFAPVTMILLLGEAGVPHAITGMLSIGVYIVYAAGILQFLGKYSMEGSA